MTRSSLNPLHGSAQFPERRRGAMPGYSTPDLGRVTHGSGHGVPLKHHLGRGFGPGSFSPALPGKGHATKYFSDYSPRHDANRDKAIFLRVVVRLHALSIGDTAWNGRGKQIAEQSRQ